MSSNRYIKTGRCIAKRIAPYAILYCVIFSTHAAKMVEMTFGCDSYDAWSSELVSQFHTESKLPVVELKQRDKNSQKIGSNECKVLAEVCLGVIDHYNAKAESYEQKYLDAEKEKHGMQKQKARKMKQFASEDNHTPQECEAYAKELEAKYEKACADTEHIKQLYESACKHRDRVAVHSFELREKLLSAAAFGKLLSCHELALERYVAILLKDSKLTFAIKDTDAKYTSKDYFPSWFRKKFNL